MWLGTVLLTIGNGLYIMFNPDTSIATIVGFEIIEGIGSGLLFEPPLLAIQQGVAQDDVGTATSTQSFVRSMALSFGVIIGGIVFQQSMDLRQSVLRDAGLSEPLLEQLAGKNAGANVMIARSLPAAQELAVKQAFSWSIRNMFIMFTAFSGLGVFASIFIKTHKLSKIHTETVTGLKREIVDPDA